ncbi:ASST-domain-containing protein [Xylariaceae sp. FL1019]|nr:ASST-domain-containing protein [Xylariaceae sp. FL1019]
MRRPLLAWLLQSLWLCTATCNVGLHGADDLFRFVTRPDLMSPKWNITYHHRELVAPGYWFVTPFKFIGHSLDDVKWIPCQVGPMIYDNDGELVWSGACQFNQRIMYDLFPVELNNQTVLKAIVKNSEFPVSNCGAGAFISQEYELVHDFFIDKEDLHVNIHEFNFIERRNTTIVTTRRPRPWSGHTLGLNEDLIWIDSNGFREYDLTTGNVTFQWHAEYHVDLSESTLPPAYFQPGQEKIPVPFTHFTRDYVYDPWHINSVDENSDGNYLVSFRHMDTIMLVAGDDGRVLWRFGGKHSDYIHEGGFRFSRQHHARYISHTTERDVISFLDNASGEQHLDFQPPSNNYSRGLIVELLRPKGEPQRARILQEYKRPDRNLADKRGALQRLPNGNVFMSWTDAGYVSEHSQNDDKVIMEARFLNETRFGTYRTYKSTNWVGRPKDPPDVRSLGYGLGTNSMTAIYVSWNGATEHKTWKFFSGDQFLGQKDKTGFETLFVTDVPVKTVRAEAYDINGIFMRKSKDVVTQYGNGWVPRATDPINTDVLVNAEPAQAFSDDIVHEVPPPINEQKLPIDLPSPPIDPGVQPIDLPVPVERIEKSETLNVPPTPIEPVDPSTSSDIVLPADVIPSDPKGNGHPIEPSVPTKEPAQPSESARLIEEPITLSEVETPAEPDNYSQGPQDTSSFSPIFITSETSPLYLGLLGIPCAIGYYVILKLLYRQVRSLIASQFGHSKGYLEIPTWKTEHESF